MRQQIDLLRPSAVFASVVAHGSFQAAAKTLDMPAPVVSQLVSDLERRLGVSLLHRTARHLTLTEAGERFFETSQSMFEQFCEGVGLVAPRLVEAVGHLQIGRIDLLPQAARSRFLQRFRDQHPEVSLSFRDRLEASEAPKSEVDLRLEIASLDLSRQTARLLRETVGLAVGLPSLRLPSTSPAKLAQMTWICLDPSPFNASFRRVDTGEIRRLHPVAKIVTDSAGFAIELAMEGVGVALLPDYMVDEALNSGHLVNLLPGWETNRKGLFALPSPSPESIELTRRAAQLMWDTLSVV